MLSHFGYDGLKNHGLISLVDFFNEFINETFELVWTTRGTFEDKAVVRSYRNLPTLQSIIFKYINYKTGEEANIHRYFVFSFASINSINGTNIPAIDFCFATLQ